VVAPFTAVINPRELITIYPSTGYTTNADGTRNPTRGTPVQILAQIQALQYNDIQMVDGLNIEGERCAMYLPGSWNGIVRADQKGGDYIVRADGTKWLVAVVSENWGDSSGWTKVICTRQLNS
jgi:hypothetical protein